MIVDTHAHVGRSISISRALSFSELKAIMDKYKISKAVVFPNFANVDSCIEKNNAMLKDLSNMKPYDRDYFIPFAWIDISHEGYIEHLKSIKEKIYGIKFHPSISQVSLADKKMDTLLKYCDENEMTMLAHCGRNPISHMKHLLEVADKYKNMTFIAAHLGGNAYDLIEDALERCKNRSMDNIFLDTSTGRHPDLLRKAIEAIGDERIVFGTDLPYTNMDLNMKYIELCELSPKEYRNIMWYNILKNVLRMI